MLYPALQYVLIFKVILAVVSYQNPVWLLIIKRYF